MFVKRSVPLAGNITKNRSETVQNSGIRPSILNSEPCTSSGSRTLDLMMSHGGIPLGSCLALLEHGTTDFSSSIIKAFCSYGINESRSGSNTRVIVLGIPDFCKSLPAINEKQVGKDDIKKPESNPGPRKIAWRYRPSQESTPKPCAYAPDLNYKSVSLSRPDPSQVTYITGTLLEMCSELSNVLKSGDGTLFRVVIPNLLHPAIYQSSASNPKEFVPFLYTIRRLISQHKAALIMSVPLQLYPEMHPVTVHINQLMDTVLELEPFENEKVQGFLHINKVAGLTQRGIMVTRRQEYAFKLAKTQFEVSEWAIPVELEEEKPDETSW